MTITKQTIDQINALVVGGMTQLDAFKEVGCSPRGATDACVRLNLQLAKRETTSDVIEPFLEQFQAGKISQKEIAQALNVSQTAVSITLRRLGIKKPTTSRTDDYQAVLEHLRDHGGTVVSSIKALGLKVQAQKVRQYARSISFNVKDYRYAHRRYGFWLTVPGPWIRQSLANYLVPAICLSCGTKYDSVGLANISTGRSRSCQKCCRGHRSKLTRIKNMETGEIFKSVMAFTDEIGQRGRYQYYRIQLHEQGFCVIDGVRFEMIS